MTLRENCVIKPGIGESSIMRPHRVLLVDRELGFASIIELPRSKNHAGKRSKYARGPKLLELATLESSINEGQIAEATYQPPGHWSMLDDEYIESAASQREQVKRRKRITQRDANWSLIAPILEGRSIRDIARNPMNLRPSLVKRAQESKRNQTTLYRLLNIYLASGGVKNSLIPETQLRGGPGVTKVQTRKLGRKSRIEKSEKIEGSSYFLQEGDTRKLAIGYRLIGKRATEVDAYRLTCAVHWSTLTEDGKTELFPLQQRPTQAQFRYWGKRLNKPVHRRGYVGLNRMGIQATPGSTQDQVCAVGQMAMIDSTSNDVYLTSIFSRLKKLPPMHVTFLKEVRSTVVIGFYVGWQSPSTWTSHQAILCGAESKVDICARFGITIAEEDWPSLLCKLILADNGEMKSQATTLAESEFRFAVEYAKSWSGQSKSSVETQHHTLHKELDHKLPGTTSGKQRGRGEKHPALEAIWNYAEYMYEFLLAIIEYNNEEVEHLAPTAMLHEGVRPTRINIMKWMMEKNMRADLPYDLERLRAFTMPPTKAVMTKRGIRLLMPDGKSHMPGIRFFAPELMDTHQFKEAVAKNKSVSITIRQSEIDLSRVWFGLPDRGLTKIPNVDLDEDLKEMGTIADFVQRVEENALLGAKKQQEEDQAGLEKLQRRGATTCRGKRELADELAGQQKRQSKEATVSGLRKNRADEMQAIKSGVDPTAGATDDAPREDGETATGGHDEATADSMDMFMRQFSQ